MRSFIKESLSIDKAHLFNKFILRNWPDIICRFGPQSVIFSNKKANPTGLAFLGFIDDPQ